MRRILFLVAIGSWACFALATERFPIDKAHSTVAFSVPFMGMTIVEGRFPDIQGTVSYDETDVTKSSITVVIKASSLTTDNTARDAHLRSADFFDVAKYPLIVFQSRSVEKTTDGLILVGDLTIHGVSRVVRIPFVQSHGKLRDMWDNTRIGFVGKLRIDSRDYGVVGPASWNRLLDTTRLTIGNDVEITLAVSARIYNFDKITFSAAPGRKPVGELLLDAITRDGIEAGLSHYRALKQQNDPEYQFGEDQLQLCVRKLLQAGKTAAAIAVARLGVEEFPDSAAAHDALGDALYEARELEGAYQSYRTSLKLSPWNTNALEAARTLMQTDGSK